MANYGYLNARVRGLCTRLVAPGFVDQVLAGGGFEAFTAALAQTGYGRDLDVARGGASAEALSLPAVDRAIGDNFRRTAASLLGYADGAAEQLVGILLRRYDVANLKAVARAFHAGKAGAERDGAADEVLSATLPVGQLGPGTLKVMAEANDLPAAAQALVVAGHPLADAFRSAVAQYAKAGDLFALELQLDQAHHASVHADARAAGAPQNFLDYLALETDATNLQTALKLRGRSLDAAACFVAGGASVSRAQFLQIASAAVGEPLPELRGPFAAARDQQGALEGWLRSAVERAARALSADPLDIGLVTHFLRAKEREAAIVRLLARGTFYGVPAETLKRELGHA